MEYYGNGDIAVVGLAVMGQNLILNMADHGYNVVAYNRSQDKTQAFMEGPAQGKSIMAAQSIEEMVGLLQSPKKIMLMVQAGPAVDAVIRQVLPHLEKGDIIIDGGNSRWQDTERRQKELAEVGIRFLGTGISGGEEGARHGPSIMPGGADAAWPAMESLFKDIAAKSSDGSPCCEWVGKGGSGHFVKMVHNGIEYGDMQLISEAWDILSRGMSLNPAEGATIFGEWNQGELNSYLIEITEKVLTKKDEDGSWLVDNILDAAGQKGTGVWTVQNALEEGVPLTLIAEAVFSRSLSAMKEERVQAAALYSANLHRDALQGLSNEDIAAALYGAKIVSYAQGFLLMRKAAETRGWDLNYGGIAQMWRGGCIIRSVFLDRIKEAFDANSSLQSLFMDEWFREQIIKSLPGWRKTVAAAVAAGIPVPALSAALAFFDGYVSANLPASLLQGQRDFFGAHTFERKDKERGEFFHADWSQN